MGTVEIGGESPAPSSGDAAVGSPRRDDDDDVARPGDQRGRPRSRWRLGTNIIQMAGTVDGVVWVSLCEGGVVSVDEQTLAVSEP